MNQEPKIYFKKPEGFIPKREKVVVCVEAEGKLLLLKNASDYWADGYWELPGGRIKSLESPEQSARRQLKRDTSIDLPVDCLIHFLGNLYIEDPEKAVTLYIFAIILNKYPSVKVAGQHRDFCWVTQRTCSRLSSMQGAEEVLDLYYTWSLRALLERFIHEIGDDLDASSQQLIGRVMGSYTRQSTYLDLYHVDINPEKLLERLFAYFPNIIFLGLYFDDITKLPDAIGNLTLLEELDVVTNNLTELPETIGNLTNLQTLNISCNQILQLPDSIGKLVNLKSLCVCRNKLEKLPESIGGLKNLQELSLSSNRLKVFPEVISHLTGLQSLYISNMGLLNVPTFLNKLLNLRNLDISRNQLKEIPDALFSFPELQSLNLSDNALVDLPDTISSLQQLKSLNLSNNELVHLQGSICSLKNLQELSLFKNRLIELPDAIKHLTFLRSLGLSYNQLTKLPESIADLKDLSSLYLTDNQFIETPSMLNCIDGLKVISNIAKNGFVNVIGINPEKKDVLSNSPER